MMAEHSQGRLLVAHPQPGSCRALGDMLRRAGHEVMVAQDGIEALDIAADLLPDLVILAVSLPGLSGVNVCEKLQADAETAGIPVIMISETSELLARTQSMEAGAVDHLCMPLDLESLHFQVANLVRMRSQGRAVESKLLKTERRERLRDEWVTYAFHEMERALNALSEDSDEVMEVRSMAQTILDCRQMSHPKALVTLQNCQLAGVASRISAEVGASADFQGEVQADPELLTRILSHLALAASAQAAGENLPTLHVANQGDDQLTIEVRAASSGIWHESYATLDQGSAVSQGLDCQNRLELSLAFCKHAIDLMGGSIGVETSPDEGLRFWLTLPEAVPEVLPNIIPFAAELLPYDTAASR